MSEAVCPILGSQMTHARAWAQLSAASVPAVTTWGIPAYNSLSLLLPDFTFIAITGKEGIREELGMGEGALI